MTRQLPTDQQVRQAMDHVLTQSGQTGHRPTISAVERRLGIPHATFHRHFGDLIASYFYPRTSVPRIALTTQTAADACSSETVIRIRQENTDLRKLVKLYEEAIRQLTLDNHVLHSRLLDHAGVTTINNRRPR